MASGKRVNRQPAAAVVSLPYLTRPCTWIGRLQHDLLLACVAKDRETTR
jgi:hypothetical protein